MKPLMVRVPDDLEQWLKDEYWRTAPKHKLSFNAWMVGKLEGMRKGAK